MTSETRENTPRGSQLTANKMATTGTIIRKPGVILLYCVSLVALLKTKFVSVERDMRSSARSDQWPRSLRSLPIGQL